MECSDICVMADKEASATLTVGDESKPSADAATIETWRAQVPAPDTTSRATAYWDGAPSKDNGRGLIIEWKTNATPADFYPYANTNFEVDGMTDHTPRPGRNDSSPQNCQEERRRLAQGNRRRPRGKK